MRHAQGMLCDLNPMSIPRTRRKLLKSKPAPTRSTMARAVSQMIEQVAENRSPDRNSLAPRLASLSISFNETLEAWSAGAKPKANPVTTAKARAETQNPVVEADRFAASEGSEK